jgi:hypothetical protein
MLETNLSQAISTSRTVATLDNAARLLWRGHADGLVDDTTAERLSQAVEARRNALKGTARQSPPMRRPARSKPCRSPDRQRSIARRRGLAASGAVPGTIAVHFTTGELAVLSLIAQQCQRRGKCEWYLDRLAACAGVCRTTAKNAIRHAKAIGLISVEERRLTAWRSDSNIIRLISAEWKAWLSIGGTGKNATSTNNHLLFSGHKPTKRLVGSSRNTTFAVNLRNEPQPPNDRAAVHC